MPDFIDMLDALRAHDVRFLIVGGYAVGVHGHPRATKDLDVWVEASPENAVRVVRALQDFGAPLQGLSASDFEREGTGLQIGGFVARDAFGRGSPALAICKSQ